MEYKIFKRQLAVAGLSVRQFSELLGFNCNSITNYSKVGTVPTHLAVIAVLIAELAQRGLDFREPILGLDIKNRLPRGDKGASLLGRTHHTPQENTPI